MTVETHGDLMQVGRHKGELITRVPVSYLKWLANTPTHREHEIGKAELSRRGTVTPSLEVSGHAIDSASLRLRKTWHQTATGPDEGLHAWLCRKAAEALATAEELGAPDVVIHDGVKWVFEREGIWPVLKTVMPA